MRGAVSLCAIVCVNVRGESFRPRAPSRAALRVSFGGSMNTVSFFRTLRSRVLFFVVAAVMAVVALPSHAQFNASLSGTVQDATGAIVPGATATLTNNATHQVKTSTSGPGGDERFSELSPGSYQLVVTAAGFQGTTLDNLSLAAETP